MRPFAFDMETSDPDDSLTLLLLLGHPAVDLKAVTVTPGSREQIGLVRRILRSFGRKDIKVGSFNPDHAKPCVSEWHNRAFGESKPEDPDDFGWKILNETLSPATTLVTGAPLKNLGALIENVPQRNHGSLGRGFIQGGFAGSGVVPPERQLEKFKGKVTCPSFNLNGAPDAAVAVLEHRTWFTDLRFVSKNVCHGVIYDQTMHERFAAERSNWCASHAVCDCLCHRPSMPGSDIMHAVPCCHPCPYCEQNVMNTFGGFMGRKEASQAFIYKAMSTYLARHSSGKAFHDPLAACCAIAPDIGEWAEVELYRERGEWGSFLFEGSGVQIITGYNHERFVQVLLGGT